MRNKKLYSHWAPHITRMFLVRRKIIFLGNSNQFIYIKEFNALSS